MWKKIATENQLKTIAAGTLIVKYPISGESVNTLDEANENNVSVRIVSKNDSESKEIYVSYSHSNKFNLEHGLSKIIYSSIQKNYESIISDAIWWFEE